MTEQERNAIVLSHSERAKRVEACRAAMVELADGIAGYASASHLELLETIRLGIVALDVEQSSAFAMLELALSRLGGGKVDGAVNEVPTSAVVEYLTEQCRIRRDGAAETVIVEQPHPCNCPGCTNPSNPERKSMPRCDWCMVHCPLRTGEHTPEPGTDGGV